MDAAPRQSTIPDSVLAQVVHKVVQAADPDRIVLFGSSARGEARPGSDIDLLVIKDGDYGYHETMAQLFRAVADCEREVDIVLITSAQAARYRDSRGLVIRPALKEGRLLYERQTVPA